MAGWLAGRWMDGVELKLELVPVLLCSKRQYRTMNQVGRMKPHSLGEIIMKPLQLDTIIACSTTTATSSFCCEREASSRRLLQLLLLARMTTTTTVLSCWVVGGLMMTKTRRHYAQQCDPITLAGLAACMAQDRISGIESKSK